MGGYMQQDSWFTRTIILFSFIIVGFILSPLNTRAEIAAVIIVDPVEGLVTDEKGGSASFTVRLDTQPGPNITIDFSSSDPSEGFVSPTKITINPGNWDKPEQNLITITGVADGIEDGDVLYQITGVASSGDEVPSVSVTNLNDPFPIAVDDHPSIDDGDPIIIPVLENDAALLDVPLEISVISDPSFGTSEIIGSTIKYSPSETFLGLDQFTYQVCDSGGDCATADVFVEDQIPPEIISIIPVGPGGVLEVIDEEITIDVVVTDNFQVDCVIFYRWDAPTSQFIILGEDCEPPYQLVLDVKDLNFGWNQINFVATDVAGNATSSQYFIWLLRLIRTHIPLILSP